jgi:hypothetical protein
MLKRIAGAPGREVDFNCVRFRLAKANMGVRKVVCNANKTHSPKSVALCLASPFFLAPVTACLPVLEGAQQANTNAARAEAEATRSSES